VQLKEIMSRPAHCVSPDATLVDAAQTMLAEDIGVLPVSRGVEVVGIITDRDITVRAVAARLDPATTRVSDVMSTEVLACPEDSDVQEARRMMEQRRVRRLLVTDAAGAPAGVVSLGDLALLLARDETGEILKEVSRP
jgi:CBS domain-containing protein